MLGQGAIKADVARNQWVYVSIIRLGLVFQTSQMDGPTGQVQERGDWPRSVMHSIIVGRGMTTEIDNCLV